MSVNWPTILSHDVVSFFERKRAAGYLLVRLALAPPNVALQPTIAIGPRLATPSLGPIAIAAELCCYASHGDIR